MGKAVGDIDASAARVLAYLWHNMSYARTSDRDPKLLTKAATIPGSCSKFQLLEVPIPVGSNRVYACKWTWMREDDDSFTTALTSVQDLDDEDEAQEIMAAIESGKSSPKSVLGELRGCYRICPQAENVCRVTYVAQGNLGGWAEGKIPAFVLRHVAKFTLDVVMRVQER